MKKIFLLLLVCALVFSITLSLTSCWNRNKNPNNNNDDPGNTDDVVTPGNDPDDKDETINIDGGTTNDGIELPPVIVPSKNGQDN